MTFHWFYEVLLTVDMHEAALSGVKQQHDNTNVMTTDMGMMTTDMVMMIRPHISCQTHYVNEITNFKAILFEF